MLFLLGALVVGIDQCSKAVVRLHVGSRCLRWGSILRLRCWANAAHVGRPATVRVAMMLVWLFTLVATIVLVRAGFWFRSAIAHFALAAAFAGAGSNLLDTVRRRPIIDFIDLGWWRVFNLADVAIVCGLAVALCA